jgi:hypothetical protein
VVVGEEAYRVVFIHGCQMFGIRCEDLEHNLWFGLIGLTDEEVVLLPLPFLEFIHVDSPDPGADAEESSIG